MHKGRLISTTDHHYSLLVSGRRYLLFLRQMADGRFEPIRDTAGYDLTDEDERSSGEGSLREALTRDALIALKHMPQ